MIDLLEIRRFAEETAIAAGDIIRSTKPAQLIVGTKKNGIATPVLSPSTYANQLY